MERQRQDKTEPEDRFAFYIRMEDLNAEEGFVPQKTSCARQERLTRAVSLAYRAPADLSVPAASGSGVRGTLRAGAGLGWFPQDLV